MIKDGKMTDFILQEYRAKTIKSAAMHKQACKVMAGGVSNNIRYHLPYPCCFARGKGSRFWDIDGNEYLDFWMGHYCNILGHSPEPIMSALRENMDIGLHCGLVTPHQVELAELICRHIPSAEKVRFCCSGTESTIYALRLARFYTQRNKIIKMEGAWHGAATESTTGNGQDLLKTKPRLLSPQDAQTIVVPFNDVEMIIQAIRKHADDLAAVIVEPIVGKGGFIPANEEYLQTIREETQKVGALLIFDEIISAFRLGLGGAQELFGVLPDITTLGKIIGGGLPIGAIAARADILERCSPTLRKEDRVLIGGGTFSCLPLAMMAGTVLIKHLERNKDQIYPSLERKGDWTRKSIEKAFAAHGIDARCSGIGSLFMTHFPLRQDIELISPNQAYFHCDVQRREVELKIRLLDRGVFVMHGGGAISIAHSWDDLNIFIERMGEVAHEMQACSSKYREVG